jgi:hypothetical protein
MEIQKVKTFSNFSFFFLYQVELVNHTPKKNPIELIGSRMVHKQIKCKPNLKGTSQPKFENK